MDESTTSGFHRCAGFIVNPLYATIEYHRASTDAVPCRFMLLFTVDTEEKKENEEKEKCAFAWVKWQICNREGNNPCDFYRRTEKLAVS